MQSFQAQPTVREAHMLLCAGIEFQLGRRAVGSANNTRVELYIVEQRSILGHAEASSQLKVKYACQTIFSAQRPTWKT